MDLQGWSLRSDWRLPMPKRAGKPDRWTVLAKQNENAPKLARGRALVP